MFDPRTNYERARDAREASMTNAARIARHEALIARATAKGISRPDLVEELAALRRRRAA